MKKHLTLICVILFSVGLLSMVFTSCNKGAGNTPTTTTDGDATTTGNGGSGGSSECATSTTRAGGGECTSDECIKQCEELFSGNNKEECLEKTVNEVDGMWKAFNNKGTDKGFLVKFNTSKFAGLHYEDIKNALQIKPDIWSMHVDGYNSTGNVKDILYWMVNENCAFDGGLSELSDEEKKDLMKKLFLKASVSGGLIPGLLEDLGAEPEKNKENFLFLAKDNSRDAAVKLVHELVWDNCLKTDSGVTSSNIAAYKLAVDDEYDKAICILGELYCKKTKNRYIFNEVFPDVVNEGSLDTYIRETAGTSYKEGLAVATDEQDNLTVVCGDVICNTNSARSPRSVDSRIKPKQCD